MARPSCPITNLQGERKRIEWSGVCRVIREPPRTAHRSGSGWGAWSGKQIGSMTSAHFFFVILPGQRTSDTRARPRPAALWERQHGAPSMPRLAWLLMPNMAGNWSLHIIDQYKYIERAMLFDIMVFPL